jgi:preprotein translocase subunit SecG
MIMDIAIYLILGIHILSCLLLTLLVLMQRPKNEGLGAAFGGGVTDSIFGAQTSDILTKGTIYLGGIFFACTLGLAILYAHRDADASKLQDQLLTQPATVSPAGTTDAEGTPAAPAPEQAPATTP